MMLATVAVRTGVAMLAVATLASCSSKTPKPSSPPSTPSAAKTTTTKPAEPPGGYDIGRIANLANQLPPGFTTTEIPRTTLTKEQADSAAGLEKQFAFTFDPPQCNTMLKPTGVEAGSESQGLQAQGPQQLMIMAVRTAQPLPDTILGAGCDRVAFSSQEGARGTAERLGGPAIDGVTTAAVKVHLDFAVADFSKTIDRLSYFALLGDKTAVLIDGEKDPQLLEDLLVKAVAAIRQK
ncbi:DUF5642 family protein [Candidatus Mycobacterium wuenschmannii]|uniref:DUF5642 family protein n=1 Tax=Candidatus Mycobacterium wuenschmannii TaxID=3027808 RepID=A0ABY8VV09_9MYCO|nr:DUF5642 family protein [Candidatus Mycobacterium wuenschmannii]WIM87347.1 DUF5642 family protein [Candidatus Mycobacterium wuenschmannii]